MIEQPIQRWQTLVTTAVLGTERMDTAMLDALAVADVESSDAAPPSPEHRLLSTAAALSLYVRAGQRPSAPHDAAPSVAEAEALRPCSLAAGARLVTILAERPILLSQWCAAAAASSLAAPPELVPALLDRAAKDPRDAESIAAVAGSRAAWLRAFNPQWAGVTASTQSPEQTWTTGTLAERIALLRRFRREQPPLAAQLIESTWGEDSADDRVKFLETLATNLSMADEPLLEAALDDKRKGVRSAAAALLASLPESRLVHRMLERLTPLMQFEPAKKGLLRRGKASIVVTLLEATDKTMTRDGLEARAAEGLGPGASLLRQMLAAAPLDTWPQRWSVTPQEIIEAAKGSEWAEPLLLGWIDAAVRQRDSVWAKELLYGGNVLRSDRRGADVRSGRMGELIGALPPTEREQAVVDLVTRWGHDGPAEVGPLLDACEHDWTRDFSDRMMAMLQQELARRRDAWLYHVRQLVVNVLSVRLHPGCAETIERGWNDAMFENAPAMRDAIDHLIATVQFRHAMLKELAP